MREYKGLSAEVGPELVLVIISKSNFSTSYASDGWDGWFSELYYYNLLVVVSLYIVVYDSYFSVIDSKSSTAASC